MGGESILLVDGERQKRLRGMLDPSLRPRAVEATTPELVEPLVGDLLDGLAGRGEAELMSEFFEPVSVLGLGRVLGLGHLDGDTLRRWFHGLAQGAINFEDDPAKWEVSDATGAEIDRELAPVLERLCAEPDGSTIATMLAARRRHARGAGRSDPADAEGDPARRHAGAGSRGRLDGRRPARVRAARGACRRPCGLVRDAVEEGLRWVSPIGTQTRRAVAETELGGRTLPAGANLGVLVSSANRDEEVWGDTADAFDLTGRTATTPRSASGRTSARATTSRACRCGSRSTAVRAAARAPARSGAAPGVLGLGVPGATAPPRALAT